MPHITSAERIGMEKGMKRGMEKGRLDGRIESRQESVIDALEVRFGEVPEGLVEEIHLIGDSAKLTELHRVAIRCESIEGFVGAL